MAKSKSKPIVETDSLKTVVDLGAAPMSTDVEPEKVFVKGFGEMVVDATMVNGKSYKKFVKDGATFLVTEKSPGVYSV